MTKKKIIPEAIPTVEMPIKSHATETATRPSRTIVQDISPVAENTHIINICQKLLDV